MAFSSTSARICATCCPTLRTTARRDACSSDKRALITCACWLRSKCSPRWRTHSFPSRMMFANWLAISEVRNFSRLRRKRRSISMFLWYLAWVSELCKSSDSNLRNATESGPRDGRGSMPGACWEFVRSRLSPRSHSPAHKFPASSRHGAPPVAWAGFRRVSQIAVRTFAKFADPGQIPQEHRDRPSFPSEPAEVPHLRNCQPVREHHSGRERVGPPTWRAFRAKPTSACYQGALVGTAGIASRGGSQSGAASGANSGGRRRKRHRQNAPRIVRRGFCSLLRTLQKPADFSRWRQGRRLFPRSLCAAWQLREGLGPLRGHGRSEEHT